MKAMEAAKKAEKKQKADAQKKAIDTAAKTAKAQISQDGNSIEINVDTE